MPDLDLDSIRARVEATTPGPWEAADEIDGVYAGHPTVVRAPNGPEWAKRIVTVGQTRRHDQQRAEANVAFIAAAREDIPALLSLVDVLDAAMHSVWLHGQWRWLTSNMTTEEREAAWAAVQRYGARLHPGEPPMPDKFGAWWREGADYAE